MKPSATKILGPVWSFLYWWLQELQSAADDLCVWLAPQWRKSVLIFVCRDRLQIADGSSSILDTPLERSGSKLTLPALEPEAAAALQGRRAHLLFDPDLAFIHSLRLPVAAMAHLESAIDLQKPRLLPLDATLLRTDFEIVTVQEGGDSLLIDLAALKRSDIEPLERQMEQWGLQLGSIQLGRVADSPRRFKFDKSSPRGSRFGMTRADRFWLMSAATLAFCAVLVFAVQAIRADRSLGQALAESSADAAVVLEQRQQLMSGLQTLSLLTQSARSPTAAAVLADVTTHLNHEAWLTHFELKGNDLRLIGLSSDPATIVKELAASTLITHVQLHSSMSASPALNTGKDRFEITAQVRTGT